ncbi:hypothetical protein C8P66_11724 [Humitalea rosea]|uniref:Gp5/Type VI secretion system Vgr protein OB-fold domain-containing protein n=1 Tax=Humitalea rosea TaxID=990373 RepID=A0A2W7I9E6_9PROT|nr:hypothetical protein [Humitalea rosea]PZW42999.1 hypothetical protein C8P66_11724 [Humitalea rosea]
MSAALFDSIARIARHEAEARPTAAIGRVTEVHGGDGSPPDHAVTVTLRDSGEVLPRVPVAVGAFGLGLLPDEGDLVLVVFGEGDWHAPVAVAGLYHGDLAPPATAADLLALHLPKGEAEPKLRLELEKTGEALRLNIGDDTSLSASADTIALAVGKITLTLTSKGGGRLELAAGGSTITLKEDGDITIEAKGKLTLLGAELDAKGNSKASLKGATVEIN